MSRRPKDEPCEHCGLRGMHKSQDCIGWGVDMLMYGTASVYMFTETRTAPPDAGPS